MILRRRACALLVVCCFPAGALFAQAELQTLRGRRDTPGDQFGYSLAAARDYVLVGAPDHRGAGAVYAFDRDDQGTATTKDDVWTQTCKLLASDLGPGDFFGGAVELDGRLAILSSPLNDEAGNAAGAAYVFYREDNGTPDIAIDDDSFQLQKLVGSLAAGNQHFGHSLAISGSTIVVGTHNGNLVYVFERDDQGTPDVYDDVWIETAVLQGSTDGYRPGRFGGSVATDGETILVGACQTDITDGDDDSGVVYVFERDDQGTEGDLLDDLWVETGRFTATEPVAGGQFGRDVSLQDDMALIGAWTSPVGGRSFAFRRSRPGKNRTSADPTGSAGHEWSQVDELLSIDGAPEDGFGHEVLLNGDFALVGGNDNDLPGKSNAGAAYAYRRDAMGTPADPSDDVWFPVAKLNASEAAEFDHAGRLASHDTLVFVGAPNSAGSLTETGAVYVFDLGCGTICLDFEAEDDFETPLANGQDISSDEEFGRLVAIDGLSSAGLQAAIFDSDPLGPNATSTDPDLLVGLGNVLILQEIAGQSVPGIYDSPDDDFLGGVLTIDFLGREVSVVSLDLIDVDPIDFQGAAIVLFDSAERTRTYDAPPGWTEDVATIGPPGFRTLNGLTLSEQDGFLAVCSNSQDPSFDPTAVVRLELHFSTSAAIDNLKFIPKALPRAQPDLTQTDPRRSSPKKRRSKSRRP